jgi:hypothetical protein
MSHWKGYYLQGDKEHAMELSKLKVNPNPGGAVQGSGSDTVGEFDIHGSFSMSDPICRFTKQYHGKDPIYYYQGTYTNGTIEGFWGIKAGEQDGKFKLSLN